MAGLVHQVPGQDGMGLLADAVGVAGRRVDLDAHEGIAQLLPRRRAKRSPGEATSQVKRNPTTSTPAAVRSLLAGSVAVGLVAPTFTDRALVDAERLLAVYRPHGLALVGGAEAALVVGWARPAPWLLALLLVAILPLPWLFAVSRCVRADRASR